MPGEHKRKRQRPPRPEVVRTGFGRFVSGTAFVLWLLLIPTLLVAILALYLLMNQYKAVRANLEQVVNIDLPQGAQATRIYARDYDPRTGHGTLLASLHIENRQDVDYTEIPPQVLACFLSTEDARFYDHKGVDIKGNLRALRNIVLRRGEVRGGGSTITQQLARNVFLPYIKSQKTLNRKIQEIIIAGELEKKFSKPQILEAYLNHIYLGASAYGIRTAAETYFGKDLKDLTLAEAALLAGLPQSPSHDDPYKKPENALERRNEVLDGLDKRLDSGFVSHLIDKDADKFGSLEISHEDIAAARKSKLRLNGHQPGSLYYQAPYFCDYVRANVLLPKYGKDTLMGEGLTVVTTLDPQIQAWAEQIAREKVDKYRKSKRVSQVVVLVLEAKTGEVLANVGGYGWRSNNAEGNPDMFNRAFFASRQVGSSFKPFTYSTAYEQGFSPSTAVLDGEIPDLSKLVGKQYPVDSDHRYYGWMPMWKALQGSRNAAAVDVIYHLTGIPAVIATARKMGLTAQLPEVPALTLGVADITPIEMAEAYDTFPNMGTHVSHITVRDVYGQDGMLLESHGGAYAVQGRSNQALTTQTAYTMVRNMEMVVNHGTGTHARVSGVEIAGKTGTCDDFSDAWFVGYSPELVCCVWVGNDDFRQKLNHVFGGDIPAEIFHDLMVKIYSKPSSAKVAKNGDMNIEAALPVAPARPWKQVKFDMPTGVIFKGFGGGMTGAPKAQPKEGEEGVPGEPPADEGGRGEKGGKSEGDDHNGDFYKPWKPPPQWEGTT